jgi:hypothetical protein
MFACAARRACAGGTERYIRNIALRRAARIIVAWRPTARLAIIDDATIIVLVDAFYARVRRDPVLAPVFAASMRLPGPRIFAGCMPSGRR